MALTVTILDRTYEIKFDVDLLLASEEELGRPITSMLRDDRGWRGFTYGEIQKLLWVQVRGQNRKMTPEKLNAALKQHLTEKRGHLQEFNFALIRAFNQSDLVYQAPTIEPDAEEPANGRPTPAAPADGTSASPADSKDGSDT